jgi:Nucleotidyl transferase AbiEii toxin, Type IV TA system
VTSSKLKEAGIISKHFVELDGVQIKIEVTPVLRGCVYEPEMRSVSEAVEAAFGFAEIQVVNFADLYAGKLVAALDRQHPRDLFDVRDLLANEGVSDELRKAFVVYIVSHNRPMAEVLAPTRQDITQEFERVFVGMTENPVTLEELLQAREDLIAELVGKMPDEHREFLASFKRGKPEWELLGLPHIEQLPAVQWKIQNLAAMDPEKRQQLIENLLKALEIEG